MHPIADLDEYVVFVEFVAQYLFIIISFGIALRWENTYNSFRVISVFRSKSLTPIAKSDPCVAR